MDRGEDLQLLREAIGEMDNARERYVHDQVSRQLAHREGDMSRTQIDAAEIQARLRWDENNPASARLMKRRYVLVNFALIDSAADEGEDEEAELAGQDGDTTHG